MSVVDKFLNSVGLIRKAQNTGANLPIAEGVGGADPFALWRGSQKINPETVFSVNNGWVYACVRAIAEEIANMQLKLFKVVTKNGEVSYEEVKEHELLDLLSAVNDHQTGYELKYLTGSHLELVGNAYWLLYGVSNDSDIPTAIYPLNPRFIKPIREGIPEIIKGYTYKVGTSTRTFQPYEILHIKYPDANDPYEGVGPAQSIMQWIDADNYATEFNRSFFVNGAKIGGLIKTEQKLGPEQMDALRKSFEAIYKGVKNAYRVGVLPNGAEYEAVGEAQKDMDFVNLQNMMRDKILAGFRVPKTALGLTEDVNRANAEATNYVFALRTIKPKMQMIVNYLNEFLVPRFGSELFLDFVDPVPENKDHMIQEMQAMMGGQPIMSVNEARERFAGLGEIVNGNSVMVDFNKTALGAPVSSSKKAQRIVSGKPTKKGAQTAKKRAEISEEIAKSAARVFKQLDEKKQELKKKDITSLSDDEYEVYWKVFATRVNKYENLQKTAVQKFNDQQKQAVLERLDKQSKGMTKAFDPFDMNNWVGVLVGLSKPILTELFSEEGKAAAQTITSDPVDILTPEVRRAIDKAVELMATKYNETTRELLKAKLTQGQEQGMSIEQLKDLVSQVYEYSDDVRAEQVAKTETFRIANDATKTAWKKTGVVKSIKWYTAVDERVCPYCSPMNGKTIGIDENFFDQGDEVTGDDGTTLTADYGDVGHPPLHPNCRCYIRPEKISID